MPRDVEERFISNLHIRHHMGHAPAHGRKKYCKIKNSMEVSSISIDVKMYKGLHSLSSTYTSNKYCIWNIPLTSLQISAGHHVCECYATIMHHLCYNVHMSIVFTKCIPTFISHYNFFNFPLRTLRYSNSKCMGRWMENTIACAR